MTVVRIKDIEITVGNRKTVGGDRGTYVGRPTALGNPFPVAGLGRTRAIEKYREWLRKQIADRNVDVCYALDRLRKAALQDRHLTLVCWCSPLPCHAEVIADELARMISTNQTFLPEPSASEVHRV